MYQKYASEEMFFYGTVFGVLITLLVFTIFQPREDDYRVEFQQEAVSQGYGEWIPDEDGKPEFRFRECQ